MPLRCGRFTLAMITYFVALPFLLNREGELVPGEAQDRQTASAALRAAEEMARRYGGAVAFSRTGDPPTGKFADAVIIKSFGDVPSLEDMLAP